jgi:hypothetical protein
VDLDASGHVSAAGSDVAEIARSTVNGDATNGAVQEDEQEAPEDPDVHEAATE